MGKRQPQAKRPVPKKRRKVKPQRVLAVQNASNEELKIPKAKAGTIQSSRSTKRKAKPTLSNASKPSVLSVDRNTEYKGEHLSSESQAHPDIAFYYPNPGWYSGDWVKNLILFFDGIALLVPDYMRDAPFYYDPAIAAGLDQHGLLHILKPEELVGKQETEKLASAMAEIISSGALDGLATRGTRFLELSGSRLGYHGDAGLAKNIFDQLKERKLARESEDGVSIPMHPMVRYLVLVLLAQILRPRGKALGLELHPATDRPQIQLALKELLSLPTLPSAGHVVSMDLQTVGVDLGAVPIDEVLSFRQEHYLEYRSYARSVRQCVRELSAMSDEDRAVALRDRREELIDVGASLRNKAKRAWKKPASFAFSIAGAIWKLAKGDVIGGALAAASSVTGTDLIMKAETGAYSYLVKARRRFD